MTHPTANAREQWIIDNTPLELPESARVCGEPNRMAEAAAIVADLRQIHALERVYRQDWQNGTLARITPKRRPVWVFIAPIAALLILAATAVASSPRHVWPGHVGSGDLDSWIELHAPTDPGAVATLTFENQPVHSTDETITLPHDGLTVTIGLDWNAEGYANEVLTIEPQDGFVAVPRTLSVGEGSTGTAQIYKFTGL